MKKISQSLIVCLISGGLAPSCIHRADSQQMLEVRADYEGRERDEARALSLGGTGAVKDGVKMPVRSAPKTAHVWIFPHETPNREYFWGGWISVVIEGDKWEFDQPPQPRAGRPASTPSRVESREKRGMKS